MKLYAFSRGKREFSDILCEGIGVDFDRKTNISPSKEQKLRNVGSSR